MPYGITQCYLPPGRGDIPAFTPAEAGTRFTTEGCKADVNLGTAVKVHAVSAKGACHRRRRDKHNCLP